jgi:hypothetical protein
MKKQFLAFFSLLMFLGVAVPGQAFTDGYQDRKGVLFGVNLGGGTGTTEPDGATEDTSAMGVLPSLRLGMGSTQDLLFDIEAAHFSGTDDGVDQRQLGFTANLNKFLTKELYLRGGFGFASGTLDTTPSLVDETQSGYALNFGLGYEMFTAADMALNLGGVFRMHTFDDFDFRFFGLQVGLTWY